MFEYVITCLICGSQRSVSGFAAAASLDDAEVLREAGHSPECTLTGGVVVASQRTGKPNVQLYTIGGA